MRLRTNYFIGRGVGGGLIDEAELAHATQHVFAAFGRALWIRDRIVVRWRLRHARQGRGLAEREIVELLAEVGFRRGRHTIGALTEEDYVQVER